MENLTYEIYLSNPRVREQIEREARRARSEAMYQYVVAPLAKMFIRMLRRAQLDLREPARVSSAAGSVA